jgi:hypothetical protein
VDKFLAMFGSNLECFFYPLLFPLTNGDSEDSKNEESASPIDSDGGCVCGEEERACFIKRGSYD